MKCTFFIENDLISSNQSGFKQGDSCINHLLSITHDIYQSLDPWLPKVFTDDTSLFATVHSINKAANDLNNDLTKITK